jgi:hypothetical protein
VSKALVAIMSETIYIIGTDHKYQHKSPEFSQLQHEGFEKYIGQIILEKSIALLAEENCEQAVKENDLTESVIQCLARQYAIQHLFCELDRKTRSENDMGPEDNIRISGLMNNESTDKIEQAVEKSYRNREAHWLRCILQKAVWPALFICGANHSIQFQQLVSRNNVTPILLSEDWSN